MSTKQVLVAPAVAGAFLFGATTIASADTVDNHGVQGSTAESQTQVSHELTDRMLVLSTSNSAQAASVDVDDGTTVSGGDTSDSSATSDSSSDSSVPATSDSSSDSSAPATSDSSSDSSAPATSDSSSDNSAPATSDSSSDSSAPATSDSSSDSSAPADSSTSNTPTVPLTPDTPDVTANGETVQVDPVPVTPDNTGAVIAVPETVASVPSVARAVQAYNQTLESNGGDATATPVVSAKEAVDKAVKAALPDTAAVKSKSSMGAGGILGVLAGLMTPVGGFLLTRRARH